MIQDGLNGMTDLRWHSLWILHFSQQLAEGIWYPRWLSSVNYGYGSPTFVFYPPFTYYLGSCLKWFGLTVEQSIIFLFCFSLFLSGLYVYFYARIKLGLIPSLIGALAYMTSPYLAFNTYEIGSISVAFGIAWVPLGFGLTEKAMINPKWSIPLALSWAILALTHLPTLLLCTIVWIPYTLLFLLWRPWKIVIKNVISIALGLGLASFYLVPVIVEQRLVDINSMKNVGGGFKNMMFGAGLPLVNPRFDLSLSQIFIQQLLAIVIAGSLSLIILRNNKQRFEESRYWLIFSLISAFLMTSWSWPIWASSSLLQKIQAPWRLLHLFSFGEAILCAILVSSITQCKLQNKLLIISIIMVILLTNSAYFYKISRKYVTFHNPGRSNLEYLEPTRKALFEGYTEALQDVSEYRPLLNNGLSSPDPIPNQPRFSVTKGKATIELLQWKSYERVLEINVEKESRINIRTYNYPAWHLYVNQKSHPIDTANNGTIDFKLAPGFYKIELIYQWTSAFILGIILSLFSLTILIILIFKPLLVT
ncbi:hypothetical protein VB715_01365 [Crocosphaera sp. UHCC 0190]|uniref:hypothetical protein n=1 Tax=Crocosphaera sp. UHCC 0190 TaxID=3110246 RepID=UPI002B203013|nr:hypothetical protein [Crocosphaera sp. UHCC 0190]MEA5508405.1 hypothetical protein [Crocosphaera sp. UHCC 0190]